MTTFFKMHLNDNEIPFYLENLEALDTCIEAVCKGRNRLLVTDAHVFELYPTLFEGVPVVVIEAGEKSKNVSVYAEILEALHKAGLKRDDYLVAVGGGVVGDVAGFAAATYRRGMRFVQVPTTLLAMVDSSIGGKVGIDFLGGKNNVGSFYQPEAIVYCTAFLKTLPERELNSGMAEVLKYAIGMDKALLERLFAHHLAWRYEIALDAFWREIVCTCAQIKARVVEADERDMGLRQTLNFGHTVGHAIEQYCNFETYTHGEAVAIGLWVQVERAHLEGALEAGVYEALSALFDRLALPKQLPETVDLRALTALMKGDKKNVDASIVWMRLSEIGRLERECLSEDALYDLLKGGLLYA